MPPRARLVLWVALLAVLIGGGAHFVRRGTRGSSEYPVYAKGAERMVQGAEIYRPDDPKPFTYPPFFAVPFVPLPAAPDDPPRPWWPFICWYAVNAGALAWILRWLHRRLVLGPMVVRDQAGPATARQALAFWGVTGLLTARHVTAVFENQSHDLLVLLGVAFGVEAACRARETAAGAWVGVAAACKATPLLFAPVLLLQLRVRALIAMGIAGVAATLLPDLVFPRADERLWVVAWADTFLGAVRPGATAAAEGAWAEGSELNQSLSGTLHRLTTPTADDPGRFTRTVALLDVAPPVRRVIILAGTGAVLGLVAFAGWVGRRRRFDPVRRLGEAGAVVCGMVLLSPMSSKSHFCVLLLPIGYCVRAWLRAGRRPLALTALLLVVLVMGTCTAKGLVGKQLGGVLLARGTVTWTAFAALCATCLALARHRENEDDAPDAAG
ncbi:MAG: glycosyltransferase family 87 protein [Planctomycetota bacterium]